MGSVAREASGLAAALDARDEAAPLPELAIMPVQFFPSDLDRGLVVVSFDPFAGRDFPDPVEAIKPVACHFSKPEFLSPPKRPMCIRNDDRAIGFHGPEMEGRDEAGALCLRAEPLRSAFLGRILLRLADFLIRSFLPLGHVSLP